MPRSASRAWAVDTSVAVGAVDATHEAHEACREAARKRRPALSGHASFETYSVLTRLPGSRRVPPSLAGQILDRAFPDRCWLTGAQHQGLLADLVSSGLAGGAVYDALVGAAALANGRILLTRDDRAFRTYELLGVSVERVEG